jgi:hypothetical protein
MDQHEKIKYLANLIWLIRSDDDIDSKEEMLLDKLAKGIGADSFSIEEAKNLVSSPNFISSYPQQNADALQLFEDMLLLAHADNRLASEEVELLQKLLEHLYRSIHGENAPE